MPATDWCARATESEVACSSAYGGVATDHGDFIHVHNPGTSRSGDFNRAVGVRTGGLAEFARIVQRVQEIHLRLGLEPPSTYEMHPTFADTPDWMGGLARVGWVVRPCLFMCSPASRASLESGLEWRSPSVDEYMDWWWMRTLENLGRDAAECESLRPLQTRFATVFKPYRLLDRGELVAWVLAANHGPWVSLFEVEVEEERRGTGLGRALMQAVGSEAQRQGASHVLLRCWERVRGFYESCGYEVCAKGADVRPGKGAL